MTTKAFSNLSPIEKFKVFATGRMTIKKESQYFDGNFVDDFFVVKIAGITVSHNGVWRYTSKEAAEAAKPEIKRFCLEKYEEALKHQNQ